MAFTSIAALAGGATATTALVLSAVAEVGLAMTVVGTVTGSKDLMKLGSVMGLVGGVGGMINKGLTAAGATSLGGEAASGALSTGAESLAADAALSSSAGALESGMAPGFGEAAQAATNAAPGTMPDLAASLSPDAGMPAPTATAPAQMPVGAPAQAPTVNDVAGVQAPTGPAGAQAPVTPADPNWKAGVTDASTRAQLGLDPLSTAPQSTDGFWKSFSDFANKNKTLFSSGLQLAGGALKGINDREMWNQRMDLEQQRLKQTGSGNTVSNFAPRGIIAGARA